MDLWKTVAPQIIKLLGSAKKAAAAAEACKSFDESKEVISKEFEEKKEELKPKVIAIYKASSTEIKTLIKEPKVPALEKHSPKVQKFLDELVKIEFPGSKTVCEATSKYGPALVSGPVIFVFDKVSTLIVTKEEAATTTREVEVEVPPPAEIATNKPPAQPTITAAATTTKVEAKKVVIEKAAMVKRQG